ncbi:MAG: hypothetical protein JEY79_15685 [Pseudodesulfovibrio sp.]|nr:hypothetical protein [Pseudodesulfovibrio sp.]
MRVLKLLLTASLAVFLFGCNGGQRVVNNQYQSAGCPVYVVASDLAYVGSPCLQDSSKCIGPDCPVLGMAKGKVTADLFVGSLDKEVKEVVIIERIKAPSGHYWNALNGPKCQLGGKEYVEFFLTINDKKQGGKYTQMLEDAGFVFDGQDQEVLIRIRNINNTSQMYLAYGCSKALFPDDIKKDIEAGKEFLRQRFAERVTVGGGV